MTDSKITSHYRVLKVSRLYQGDILKDISFDMGGVMYNFPYIVILSQDCDLSEDFKNRAEPENENNDKFLQTILVCPAYLSESFFKGEHITNWKMHPFQPKEKDYLKNNDKFKRYHYLCPNDNFRIPDLVIDFKHFLTIPRELLYDCKSNYVASLEELFREYLSQRFANYIARIGLPDFCTTM